MKFFHRSSQILVIMALALNSCRPAPSSTSLAAFRSIATSPLPSTTAVTDAFPTTTDPRQTIPFLASDELAGRLPGTPGIQRAGDFLAAELTRIGLPPLPGLPDYFQPFSMNEASTIAPSTFMALNDKLLQLSKDFSPLPLSSEGDFQRHVVFAGYGITRGKDDPSHYDDYAGIDVRGKVVLAMKKDPLNEKGISRFAAGQSRWSTSALYTIKAKTAADHGAVALLLVSPPASGGADSVDRYLIDKSTARIPVIQITREAANQMLATAVADDLKSLQDQINTSFKPHSIELPLVQLFCKIHINHTRTVVRNVMAYLPGIGPHADEWVVVGAHYDHLGNGQLGHIVSGRAGSIWHGADDNASGTATVLELADRLKHSGPLPRSVLFIFFTAEEEGLVGSDYFIKHPLIPLDKIVAMLNLDMVGRLRSNSLQIGGAGTAANFDSIVAAAVANTGLTTTTALPDDGGRGGLGPSDHMSFALQKIPVLFLFTGMHADYHRPTDTADKINYAGVDELADVSQRIVSAMSVMPRQQYNDNSDSNSMTRALAGHAGHRAMLGIVPDDSSPLTSAGVPISGVVPGSPADKAGLKGGDIIVAMNSKPLKSLSDLAELLTEAHSGDKVKLSVLRDGKAIELMAELTERHQ